MNTYRFHAQPHLHFAFSGWGMPELNAASFAETLAGSTVRGLTAAAGGYDVDLRLDRASHQQALDDLSTVLQQVGFNVAEVIVTEWVSSVVEGALLGVLGGGAVGSKSQDAATTLIVGAIGALAGGVVGSHLQTVRATYLAQRLYPYAAGWQLTQLKRVANGPAFRPAA